MFAKDSRPRQNRVANLMSDEIDERNRVAKLMSVIESPNWWAKSNGWVAKWMSEIESSNLMGDELAVDSNARVRSPSPIRQWTTVWVTAVGGGVEVLRSSTKAGARAHTIMEWVWCVWLGVGIVSLVDGFHWTKRSWLTLLSASSTSVSTR